MIFAVHLIYRYLFCRKGYGIHSPFVYDLITNVIEEKRAYYCYEQLKKEYFALRKHNRQCLSRKEYELLFRIANYLKPAKSLIIAEDSGLSALYVTAFSKDAICVSIDCSASRNEDIGKYDLIVCHLLAQDVIELLERVKDETVTIIISGIRNSNVKKKLWQNVCNHPKVSITIDLLNVGLIFFNPKLHKKTYESIII